MEVSTLKAELRSEIGSNKVARLRQAGRVPAVLYSSGNESTSLSVLEYDIERELRHHHRVFKLDLGGKSVGVLLKDAQFDVVNDRPLHLDFQHIDLDKPVKVDVDLNFVGHPAAASRGGALVRDQVSLTILALPAAVPDSIAVTVTAMDLGHKIHAKDLALPAGVTLIEGTEDDLICHVPAVTAAAEAEAEAGAAGETPSAT